MSDTSHVDPLGREIVLKDRTWYGHILPKHPDVANDRDLVEEAIVRPIKISYDPSNPDRRRY